MAFVNEYVSQEDIEKYGLEELHRRYSDKANNYNAARDGLHDRSQWMIDRQREIWFMRLGIRKIVDIPPIYPGDDIYILHYSGKNIEIVMQDNRKDGSTKFSDNPFRIRWDILSISPLSLDKTQIKEIVNLIQEAMEVYGLDGVGQYERYPMNKGLSLDIQVRYIRDK